MIEFFTSKGEVLQQGAFREELSKVAADGIKKFKLFNDIKVTLGQSLPESKSLTVKRQKFVGKPFYDIFISTEDSEAKYLLASELYMVSMMETGGLEVGYDKNLMVKTLKFKGYDRAGNQLFSKLPPERRPKAKEAVEMGIALVRDSVGLCVIGLSMIAGKDIPLESPKDEPVAEAKKVEASQELPKEEPIPESVKKKEKPRIEIKPQIVTEKFPVFNPSLSREEAYNEFYDSALAVEARYLMNRPISTNREQRVKDKDLLLRYEKNIDEFDRIYGDEKKEVKEASKNAPKQFNNVKYSEIALAGKDSQWFKGQFHEAKGLSLDVALKGINDMYGLVGVKTKIREMLALKQLGKERGDLGDESGNHLLFFGNPGVGKTTVARLLGEVFREIGMLQSGHVVEVTASTLVGPYLGQSGTIVDAAFKAAHGGVLLLDEIDSIGAVKDYGQEVVNAIVKLSEDMRKDLIVVGAGYKEKMESFLARDIGLASRFSDTVKFPNYNAEECSIIFNQMLKVVNKDLALTYSAEKALLETINEMIKVKGTTFGNARDMRQLLSKILKTQAMRVVRSEGTVDKMIIEKEDI